MQLGVIPCAPYAVTGSPELAEAAAQFCREYHGAFLEHHGAVTWGADVMQALFRTESLEHTVTMYEHMLALGTPRLLTERQLEGWRPCAGASASPAAAARADEGFAVKYDLWNL